MIVISRKDRLEYVLREDRNSKEPTVFVFRPLTARERAECEDVLTSASVDRFPMGTFAYKVLKNSLVGWRNLKDDKGKDVPFVTDPDGKITDECLALLSTAQRFELSDAAWRFNELGEEEVKN